MKTFWMGLAAACVGLVGCASEDPTSGANVATGTVMVTVDGKPISESLFSYYSRSRTQKEPVDLSQEERDALMEELIQLVLLSNAADSTGLSDDPEFAAELELQRLQTVARKQISAQLDAHPVTEAELNEAYDANLEQLAGVQYKARHILVEEESEAREIISELQRGGDFQELARSRSTGPSGPSGGDLGWFSADRMVPPFAAAVRSMEVGSFTDEPVQTRFGWHVIMLEDKSEGCAPGLDAVRGDVTNIVEQERVQSYLEGLRSKANLQR
jgi:peptidyl-prolyl cis-trans isomerase C